MKDASSAGKRKESTVASLSAVMQGNSKGEGGAGLGQRHGCSTESMSGGGGGGRALLERRGEGGRG